MSNTMQYKDYVGSVEFSENDCVFFGKVLGIRAMISYEGKTAEELCASNGLSPEVPYKGSFNVRISPEVHRQAAIQAMSQNMSLNSFVEGAIRHQLENDQL